MSTRPKKVLPPINMIFFFAATSLFIRVIILEIEAAKVKIIQIDIFNGILG